MSSSASAAVTSTSVAGHKRAPPAWLVRPSRSPAKPRLAPDSPAAARDAKRAFARRMRQLFCKDGMLLENGDLNPECDAPPRA